MSQNALVLDEIGTPLSLQSRPIPEPKRHEILLKILSVGLNPHDQKIRDQGIIISPDSLPYIAGNDIAGVVEKLGTEVSGFSPGDRVFGQANTSTANGGGLQQYAIIQAELAAKIPASITIDDAATLPTVAMTAFIALFHSSGLGLPAPYSGEAFDYPSNSLLVIGGGSNCGKMAVQFARLVGFGKIVVLAAKTAEKEAELKQLGATHILDRHAENVAQDIRNYIGDNLIYAIDTVNGGNFAHTLGVALLSSQKKGTLVTLLPGSVDESRIGDKKAGYEAKFSRGSGYLHRELGKQFWKYLPGWLETSEIRPLPYDTISGLDKGAVNALLDSYRDGQRVTKTNVHSHTTP